MTDREFGLTTTPLPAIRTPQMIVQTTDKEWVGLTEQEQSDIAWEKDKSRIWIVTATEAKLKEKNT